MLYYGSVQEYFSKVRFKCTSILNIYHWFYNLISSTYLLHFQGLLTSIKNYTLYIACIIYVYGQLNLVWDYVKESKTKFYVYKFKIKYLLSIFDYFWL